MTRIQELEREIELLKEIVRLRKELNNLPQYQPAIYPTWQQPYYYPYQYGTITCNDITSGGISSAVVSGGCIVGSPIVTSGYLQAELGKIVDGPASFTKEGRDYQVGYGG